MAERLQRAREEIQGARAEGRWRDVRVLDADDIEQALEESAAVRIWLSELLDMPALGVATVEESWRRFSNGFALTLTPGVVLAGREDHAAALLRRLLVDVGRTFIKAASIDDGLASNLRANLPSLTCGPRGGINWLQATGAGRARCPESLIAVHLRQRGSPLVVGHG